MSPEKDEGRAHVPADTTYTSTNHHHEAGCHHSRGAGGRSERNAPVGPYTNGFREGFDRGAQDALRLMGRRCRCLDCAAEVEKLVEYYTGAADRRAS